MLYQRVTRAYVPDGTKLIKPPDPKDWDREHRATGGGRVPAATHKDIRVPKPAPRPVTPVPSEDSQSQPGPPQPHQQGHNNQAAAMAAAQAAAMNMHPLFLAGAHFRQDYQNM